MNSIRIRFKRGEGVKFISHLDLMKSFERAIRRSGLPIAYSQGFNPHPQMVFGLPLSVGVTSDSEYADFELAQEIKPEQFMQALNESLPEAIRVTDAAEKFTKGNIMASISGAEYALNIFFNETFLLEDVRLKLKGLMEMDSIKVLKEGKGAAKEVDIRHMILDAWVEDMKQVPLGYENFKGAFTVHTKFKAGNTSNLRPELFMKALVEHADLPIAACRLHRKALYAEENGEMTDPMDKAIQK